MPRYFFDLNDGTEVRDEQGRELSGVDAARAHATRMIGRYVRKSDQLAAVGGTVAVDARDSAGNHVFTAQFVLNLEGR